MHIYAIYRINPGETEPAFTLVNIVIGPHMTPAHWRSRTAAMPSVLDVTANPRGWCIKNNMTAMFTNDVAVPQQH